MRLAARIAPATAAGRPRRPPARRRLRLRIGRWPRTPSAAQVAGPDDAVGRQPATALEAAHRPRGGRPEDAVGGDADPALQDAHRARARAAGAAAGRGGAGAAAHQPPGDAADDAVDLQAVTALQAAHGARRVAAEDAVDRQAQRALELADRRAAVAALEGGKGGDGRRRSEPARRQHEGGDERHGQPPLRLDGSGETHEAVDPTKENPALCRISCRQARLHAALQRRPSGCCATSIPTCSASIRWG